MQLDDHYYPVHLLFISRVISLNYRTPVHVYLAALLVCKTSPLSVQSLPSGGKNSQVTCAASFWYILPSYRILVHLYCLLVASYFHVEIHFTATLLGSFCH